MIACPSSRLQNRLPVHRNNRSIRATRPPAVFPLEFRIPGWCANPALAVNGSAVAVEQNTRGFVRVSRSWQPGDTVRLHFPMIPFVRTGRDESSGTHLEVAHSATPVTIRENNNMWGVPYASISFGPLLFALPIPDTAMRTHRPCRAVEVRVGRTGSWPDRGALCHAVSLGLAAGTALKLRVNAIPMSGIPTESTPAATVTGRESRGPRECYACPLWLHEISDLDVPCYRRASGTQNTTFSLQKAILPRQVRESRQRPPCKWIGKRLTTDPASVGA